MRHGRLNAVDSDCDIGDGGLIHDSAMAPQAGPTSTALVELATNFSNLNDPIVVDGAK